MSLQLPNFATELFEKVARENGFNNFSMEIESGSKPGDGFSSEIYRIKIIENGSSNKLELLSKIAPANENRQREFLSEKIFKREAIFYQNFAPILAQLQEEKQLSKSDQFRSYAKYYGSVVDDDKQQYAIVLEDLRPLDFKMWDSRKPTTIENARITMRELGKLHGISIALKDQKPNEFEEFKLLNNMVPEYVKSENMLNMFQNTYTKAYETLKNEDHKRILLHIKNNFFGFISHCCDGNSSKRFGVFCHGDSWNNNLLFRFNEQGVTEDIRLLDWQVSCYGSPAMDVLYNIFTSTDKALRDKEYTNLIQLYYESLSKMVKLLGSDPDKLFTYEDLLGELKTGGMFALLMVPFLLQISLADSIEIPNLDEMCDKVVEGEGQIGLVTGLSTKGQSEYDRRLNEAIEDIIKLGYHQMNQ